MRVALRELRKLSAYRTKIYITCWKRGTVICPVSGLQCGGVHGTSRVGPCRTKSTIQNLPEFPKRIPEKLKAIREHLKLTPDEIASIVGARTGAEILAYENDEDDLLVTVLWNYSKLAGCPIDQILYDNLEVTFRDLQAV